MKKKILTAVTSAGLMASLVACGSSGSKSLSDDVEYTVNGPTAEASASFATPFAAEGTETHVIDEGDGDQLADGDVVVLNATSYNGADGSLLGSTFQGQPIVIPISDDLKTQVPELYDVLSQGKVGMTFSYTTNETTVADSNGTPSASAMPAGSATNVEIYSVSQKLLSEASGTENSETNSALESFTIGDDGAATITLSDDRGDAPTDLVSEDLIEGDGAVVNDTDTVFAKYQGVRWEDGEAFDGNYDSEIPAQFSLDSVISGWKQGLAGHKVGSRVLLIIPSEMAYGDDESSGMPTGPLVFVVDILGTAPASQAVESAEPSESASTSATAEASDSASPSESASSSATATASEPASAEATE